MQNAGLFLIQTVFDLAIFIILLRFMLQLFRANFYNPIVQGIVKVTDPVLLPIRRFIPSYKKIDMAAIALLLGLELLKFLLIVGIVGAGMPNILGLLIAAVAGILHQLTQLFFYAILLVVIMSWINPLSRHPAAELLYQLTEPLLAPARRLIPRMGGFDLSPIVVLIVIKLIGFLVSGV
jgi:YggT family protein